MLKQLKMVVAVDFVYCLSLNDMRCM